MTNIAPKKRGPKPPKTPKIGRSDCGGGGDIDEWSASRIWKEHCLKVEAIIPEPGEFSFNPYTLHYMCQPPPNFYPSIHVSDEELETYKKFLEKYSMIKDMDKTPPEKYELPQTISQEYGWIGKTLVPKNPLFNYDNNSCEITRYAAHYYSLMHTTPFSKKEPIAALAPPGSARKAAQAAAAAAGSKNDAPSKAAAQTGATIASGPTDSANSTGPAPAQASAPGSDSTVTAQPTAPLS